MHINNEPSHTMKIETELNCGDAIYFIESGVVNKGKVTKIQIDIEKTKMPITPQSQALIRYQIDERIWCIEAESAENQKSLFDKIKIKE